jgi:hypothetical protein
MDAALARACVASTMESSQIMNQTTWECFTTALFVVVAINRLIDELLHFRELGIKCAVGQINVEELSRAFFSIFEDVA